MRKVSTQEADNAKCYSILRDVFEYTFLSLNVKWGQVLAKGNKKDNDQHEKIYLSNVDEFIDMLIEILKLGARDRKDAKKIIAAIMKNLFRNKIKRDLAK